MDVLVVDVFRLARLFSVPLVLLPGIPVPIFYRDVSTFLMISYFWIA
jgi:hypothetical protein